MQLDLQIACQTASSLPKAEAFKQWAASTLRALGQSVDAELTIRLVDNEEIQQLNRDYRGKDKPTNVLSFPFEPYDVLVAYAGDVADLNLLGDIVIAPAVIEAEAQAQQKPLIHHYAHMTIHGVLHLLGYDHIQDDEAEEMEALEIRILSGLGIENPYLY